MSTYVAGPVQPSQERYDSCGHALASYVSQGYREGMYAGKVKCTIWLESFQQGQERKQATWYWVYDQSPQENLHQGALQPLQEAWGCAYYAQHKRLL